MKCSIAACTGTYEAKSVHHTVRHQGRGIVIMMVVGDVALGIVKTAHLARKVTGGTVEWSK